MSIETSVRIGERTPLRFDLTQGLRQFAWRVTLRTFGWGYPFFGILTVLSVFGVLETNLTAPPFERVRLVETFLPLLMGIQAALLFSPDDEPALEILMACPRPLWWLLLERFCVLFIVYAISAIGLSLLILHYAPSSELVMALVRWIAPALFLSGLAIWITVRSREATLGVLIVGLGWFVLAFFSQHYAPGAPPLPYIESIQKLVWPFHPYMQPEFMSAGEYWLNRVLVMVIGLVLMLMGTWMLRNPERLLLGSRR